MANPIMAAPNQSEIIAGIISVEKAGHIPDKWNLELRIEKVHATGGPDFISNYIGKTIGAFAFNPGVDLSAGLCISATAEYLGGPHQGLLQLTDIKPVSQDTDP